MKGLNKLAISLGAGIILGVQTAMAHCPLCTIGAAAAAGGAAWLGVNNAAIGVFIGAFGVSTGWWIGRMIKKKVIPLQTPAIALFSFVTTIIPIGQVIESEHARAIPIYISWLGEYGTTFAASYFIAGALLGGLITSITPIMSARITKLRNDKKIPYQGIILTFALLIMAGAAMQFAIK